MIFPLWYLFDDLSRGKGYLQFPHLIDRSCFILAAIKKSCPLVKEEIVKKVNTSAKNIFFQTNSAKLLPKSFKALNDVAAILKEEAALKLD